MDASMKNYDEKWLAKIERAATSLRSEGERAVQRAARGGDSPSSRKPPTRESGAQ